MSSKLFKLLVVAITTISVTIAAVRCARGVEKQIEDYGDYLEDLTEDYKSDMDKIFWQQQEIADKMIAKSGGNDGYALKEMSRLLATIETSFYTIERNSILVGINSFKKNLDSLMEDDELTTLLSLRVGMRFVMDSFAAIRRPEASLYKLIEYYVSRQNERKESIPEEVKSLIQEVFRLFDFHYTIARGTFVDYDTVVDQIAKMANLQHADIMRFAESKDYLIDAESDCKDCWTEGKVYIPEHNIRSMFSSQQELENFPSKAMDVELAKKLDEIRSRVEGHLSVKLDSDDTIKFDDLKNLSIKFAGKSLLSE